MSWKKHRRSTQENPGKARIKKNLTIYLAGKTKHIKWDVAEKVGDYNFISSDTEYGDKHGSIHDCGYSYPRKIWCQILDNGMSLESGIAQKAINKIEDCDILVAVLIDDVISYGSIAEIAYASALNKKSYVVVHQDGECHRCMGSGKIQVVNKEEQSQSEVKYIWCNTVLNLREKDPFLAALVAEITASGFKDGCMSIITNSDFITSQISRSEIKNRLIREAQRYDNRVVSIEANTTQLARETSSATCPSCCGMGIEVERSKEFDAYWFVSSFPHVRVHIVESKEQAIDEISKLAWKECYYKYLLSDEWKEKRDIAYKRFSYRCAICNSDNKINAHHRTYENVGDESQDDLTVLCEKCHEKNSPKITAK
jgi:hypothetical protein